MIQKLNTTSFGTSASTVSQVKAELKEAQDKKDKFIAGALGTTGAAAVAKGNQVMKAGSGIFKKSSNALVDATKNSTKFQRIFTEFFNKTVAKKGFQWVGKLVKNNAVRGIGKVFGGVTAVGLCIGDFSNIINTFGGNKINFPTLSNFGK